MRPSVALGVRLIGGLVILLTACAGPGAPGGSTADAPGRLYVADALEETITPLDARSGRVAGPALPGGPAPGRLVPGPAGSLLVLSMATVHVGELTHVTHTGVGWVAKPVRFGVPAGQALLAGDGDRYAAVTYQAADADLRGPRCRLALVDAQAGAVVRTSTVCRPGERVGAVALAAGPAGGAGDGPVAYLAIQPVAPAGPGLPVGGPPRVVAVEATTGRVLAGLPLAGVPSHLVLGPGAGGASGASGPLYVVETLGPPAGPDDPPRPYVGRLLGLDPETLEVRGALPLARPPLALAVAPDGARAYALVGRGDPARGDGLTALDLVAGEERLFAVLPGGALDLAATAERVYASAWAHDAVWALDRRTGRLLATLPAGRGPAGLALGGPP